MIVICCLGLSFVTGLMLYNEVQHRLTVAEYELKLSEANDALIELLEKETKTIQYDRAAVPTYTLPLSDELQQYTYDRCRYYGIEDYYEIVLAMMWRESTFDPTKISSTNDYGLMQINECNLESLNEILGSVDIMDPESNIESGVYILSTLFERYESIDKALMAYNLGPGGAAKQWSQGNYTNFYSRDITSKAELIKSNQYPE